jgi:hypothetical protein
LGALVTLSDIIAAYGRDALYAARMEARIADDFEGLGDPYFDTLARSHRATSRALLSLHISQRTL